MKTVSLFFFTFLFYSFNVFAQTKSDPSIGIKENSNELIQWNFSISKADNLVTIQANCRLQKEWHIFSTTEFGDGSIAPTNITIEGIDKEKNHSEILEVGDLLENDIEDMGHVKYFKNNVGFSITFETPKDKKIFNGEVSYQLCNDIMCMAPTSKKFTVTLK